MVICVCPTWQFFWKTYYDTYAASTCLQVKFWRRVGSNVTTWARDPFKRRSGMDKKVHARSFLVEGFGGLTRCLYAM